MVTVAQHRRPNGCCAADVALTPADLAEIAGAVAAVDVQGARYPEHLQRLVGR